MYLVMKARRIPVEALLFSPQWKTQEAEFYTKWRMATVAAVATSRRTLFTSEAKESNQKATVFLLPIPGPPQEGNAYSRGGSPSCQIILPGKTGQEDDVTLS